MFIGVDPHKLSATIEVVDEAETVLATGRCATDKAGYTAMRKHVSSYPDRVWAVEDINGARRPLAQRLIADGESVRDVPEMHSSGRAGGGTYPDSRPLSLMRASRSPRVWISSSV